MSDEEVDPVLEAVSALRGAGIAVDPCDDELDCWRIGDMIFSNADVWRLAISRELIADAWRRSDWPRIGPAPSR